MKWWTPLFVRWGIYDIPTDEVFALNALYLYPEKQLLIEAFERWLDEGNHEK